jgi:mannose-6-phosphate isomerase-like protein (cupin superfamily)
LLYAEIPDVAPIDPGFLGDSPLFMVVNWQREPVYASEHDARKRVSLVTPLICRTAAIKIEMVIYPPGNMAPNYHHEGADTFVYVVSGRGTAWSNEQPFSVRQGDLLYFPDRERHYLKAEDAGELRFLELYVPGEFKTVWADKTKASVWRSTGLDINDRETELDERERDAFGHILGNPFIR